jgi:hypothetical protein
MPSAGHVELLIYNTSRRVVNLMLTLKKETRNRQEAVLMSVNQCIIRNASVFAEAADQLPSCELILEPGLNTVSFVTENTGKAPSSGEKTWIDIEGSVFDFFHVSDLLNSDCYIANGEDKMGRRLLLEAQFPCTLTTVLSGEVNVDVAEYPWWEAEIGSAEESGLFGLTCLGFDLTQDGVVDGYILLEALSGRFNILDLVRKKWEAAGSVILKKVIFLSESSRESLSKNEHYRFCAKALSAQNDMSVIVTKKNFTADDVVALSNGTLVPGSPVTESFSFDPPPDKRLSGGSIHETMLRLRFPQEKEGWSRFPLLVIDSELKGISRYKLAVAAVVGGKGAEKTVVFDDVDSNVEENQMEIDLREVVPVNTVIKELLVTVSAELLKEDSQKVEFRVRNMRLLQKFPYPLTTKATQQQFVQALVEANPALMRIDRQTFRIKDFTDWQGIYSRPVRISGSLVLGPGMHDYILIKNDTVAVDGTSISVPKEKNAKKTALRQPQILLKKISPVRYYVEIKKLTEPCVIVFTENFHAGWKLFDAEKSDGAALLRKRAFSLRDVLFLFKQPVTLPHFMVNGYANGWYIDPAAFDGKETLKFTLFFLPQSFFCLGMIISILVTIVSIIFSGAAVLKKKWRRNAKIKIK